MVDIGHRALPMVMALMVLASSLGAMGCAESGQNPDTSSGTAQSSSSGGGGDGMGGAGGAGGSAAACAIDCATVDTPQCYEAQCNAMSGQCEIVPTAGGESCDDELFCTTGETCVNGLCGGGSTNNCGLEGDQCNYIVCDEDQDKCELTPFVDGTLCIDDSDLCIVNATCQAGVCQGVQKDCFFAPVPDVCHVSACNPQTGKCEPIPSNDGIPCPNDGDLCIINKTCQGGVCAGITPKNCSALTGGCFVGVCDSNDGQCKASPIPMGSSCQEAVDECNTGACDAVGNCLPVPTPGIQCASQTNDCNIGQCDIMGACVGQPVNEGGVCEDGNSCTTGEACAAGACMGGVLNNYIVYFSEPFTSDMTGWTLGPEWAIGAASASACSNLGNADPSADVSMSADNGIAGAILGGCPQNTIHGMYYLESPAVDANVPGNLYLDFQRWLNSDFKPYMRNTIEVFDGMAWITIWQSGGPPGIKDSGWTRITHDISAYKNAALKIRFGYEVQNTQGFVMSGWNIDEVILSNNICQ